MSTDNELRLRVTQELAREGTIDGAGIGVAAHHGVVTLTGLVDCWRDKHAAEQATYRVAGVHDVANDIQIKPAWSTNRSDAEIAETVRDTLRRDLALRREPIRVTVADGGDVTLTGTVDTLSKRDEAERIVGHVPGVRWVTNDLVVQVPTMAPGELRAAIRLALVRHVAREADKIEVALDGDTVVLSGTVDSWSERRVVVGVVRGTLGVRRLDDRMQVADVGTHASHRTGYER